MPKLLVLAFLTMLTATAHAGDPTTVRLPDGEPTLPWTAPLRSAGLSLVTGHADVTVTAHGDQWTLTVGGATFDVPAPQSATEREAIALLASSLATPLSLRGLAPPALTFVGPPPVAPPPVASAAPPRPVEPREPQGAPSLVDPAPAPAAVPAPPADAWVAAPAPPEREPQPDSPPASPAPDPAPAPTEPPIVDADDDDTHAPQTRPTVAFEVWGTVGARLRRGSSAEAAGRVAIGVVVAEHAAFRLGAGVLAPSRPDLDLAAPTAAVEGWLAAGWAPTWTWSPSVLATCGLLRESFRTAEAPVTAGVVPSCGAQVGVAQALPRGVRLGLHTVAAADLRTVQLAVGDADAVARSAWTFRVGLDVGWRTRPERKTERE